MRDKSQLHPFRSLFWLTRELFVLTAVFVAAFAVVGYANGWITFQHDQQEERATIWIETGDMNQATQHAVERGREMIEGRGDSQEVPGGDAAESSDIDKNASNIATDGLDANQDLLD